MVTREEWFEKDRERTGFGEQLRRINTRLCEITMEFKKRGRFTPDYYQQLIAEQASLKVAKMRIEGQCAEMKQWIRQNPLPPDPDKPVKIVKVGLLHEDDLKNALAEPQNILLHAYRTMKRLVRMNGATDADRTVLDMMEDYFRRNAMTI